MAFRGKVPRCECGHLIFDHFFEEESKSILECRICNCDAFVEDEDDNGW